MTLISEAGRHSDIHERGRSSQQYPRALDPVAARDGIRAASARESSQSNGTGGSTRVVITNTRSASKR